MKNRLGVCISTHIALHNRTVDELQVRSQARRQVLSQEICGLGWRRHTLLAASLSLLLHALTPIGHGATLR
jgi:hypothetical protein